MIQVLNRALDLLEQIAIDPETPKSLSGLADNTLLNYGTCANILKTLVNRSYVEQVGRKKGYILGAKSYTLTGNNAYQKDLLEAAKDEMDRLTQTVNENCLLAILKENQRVVIYCTLAEQDLQVRTTDIKPAYDSASGRLLIAMLPKEKIQRMLRIYGLPSGNSWPEIQSETELYEALRIINRNKLSIQSIPYRQVTGLSVPIYKNNLVIASLSIYLPDYRYMATDKLKLVESLRSSAQVINDKLLQNEVD